ncbi:hypothetical protein ACLOJK_027789 [Asimina triloba]
MGIPNSSFLFLLFFLSPAFLAESKTDPSDIKALKLLRRGLDPASITPGSCISSWNFSFDPCDAIFSQAFTCGFRCDLIDAAGFSRITEISLDHAAYAGSLSLSHLPFLDTLDVADNLLTGPIASPLSKFPRLRRLSLSANAFDGEIPASIGSLAALEELYLDHNRLRGSLPPSLAGLSLLKTMELHGNNLSGALPDLSALKSLSLLDLSDNQLSGAAGPMPESIAQISLRNNAFQQLPDGVGGMQLLQVLDLSNNRLWGGVPAALFTHPSLQQLTLSHNQLTWIEEPADSGAGSQLIALDLSYNALGGTLPDFLGRMPALSALSLESNRFTGMIPAQYAMKAVFPGEGVEAFQRLLLSGNYLFGPIPGPLLGMKPGSANVSLVDNCLWRCPRSFFFCQGGEQKPLADCKNFSPVIP